MNFKNSPFRSAVFPEYNIKSVTVCGYFYKRETLRLFLEVGVSPTKLLAKHSSVKAVIQQQREAIPRKQVE